jgi:hypothetical protein
MALFAPAFLFYWTSEPYRPAERLAFLTFFFVLGFAVFLYLPLRSLNDSVLNWGDPQTWQHFLAHLSDRKDAAVLLLFSASKLLHQIRVYLANLSNEFFTLGIVLGLLGCLYICRIDKPLALLLGLVFLGNVSFFIRLWTVAFGFLPSFVIFALWIGYDNLPLCLHSCIGRGVPHSLMAWSGLSSRGHGHHPRGAGPPRCCRYGPATTLLTMGTAAGATPSSTILSRDAGFTHLYLRHVERRRRTSPFSSGAGFLPAVFAPLSKHLSRPLLSKHTARAKCNLGLLLVLIRD